MQRGMGRVKKDRYRRVRRAQRKVAQVLAGKNRDCRRELLRGLLGRVVPAAKREVLGLAA